jgi:hypothetical protein
MTITTIMATAIMAMADMGIITSQFMTGEMILNLIKIISKI